MIARVAENCSPTLMPLLRFELVTEPRRLHDLAPAWEELLRASVSPEPMLSPAWLLSWWDIYAAAGDQQLRLGLFFAEDELIGLAPLWARRHRYGPGLSLRRLEFLGADVPENDGIASEYLNLVVRAGEEETVARNFAWRLARGDFGLWEELVLPAMDGTGVMPNFLVEALQDHDFDAECKETTQAPFLPLPSTWAEFLAGISKKRRQAITYAQRDLEQWADGTLGHRRVEVRKDLPRGLNILAELHQERWQADGTEGAFASTRFRAFHERFAAHLLEQRQLDLSWLEARGQPLAVQYNFVDHRKVYYYQCGRRVDVPDHLSPGSVLLARTIQEAIQAGRREFDFLAGPAPYKLHWTKQTRPLVQVRATRPSLAEYLRRAAWSGKQWLRGLRKWWPGANRQP